MEKVRWYTNQPWYGENDTF